MALIKFGGGIVAMSGSIAGNTFARNRYGNYVRARTKPVNTRSIKQVLMRCILASLVARWYNTLTPTQRTAWGNYASNVNMKNRLGETTNLSGFNMYVRYNSPRVMATYAPVDEGPINFTLPSKDPTFAVVADVSDNALKITFDNTLPWYTVPNSLMVVYQGVPQNKTRNFFNGPWRYVGYLDNASVSPVSLTPVFPLVAGHHQWVTARICEANGRLSEIMTASCFTQS